MQVFFLFVIHLVDKTVATTEKKIKEDKILLKYGQDSAIITMRLIPEEIRVKPDLFEELWNLHPEKLGQVKLFGKLVDTPRRQQSYGQPYTFSGMNHPALPIQHPFMSKILAWVNQHSGRSDYKMILMNWYKSGDHAIGAHSDDEVQILPGAPIYSFSFGQARDFIVKSKGVKGKRGDYNKTFMMTNNSLIIMCGEMQKYYTHQVPKRAVSKCPGRRINITMRAFKS